MGRRSRALFSLLLARERERERETRKEEIAGGSQKRVKDTRNEENFEDERPRLVDSRANCEISSRDFALTFARSRVSLMPHQAYRIKSRCTIVVNFDDGAPRKFMAAINTSLQD